MTNERAVKQSRAAKAGSGIAEDGVWTPEFEGQRPPFAP